MSRPIADRPRSSPLCHHLPLAIPWTRRPARAIYPSGNRPSLWNEFWVLTRAVYGILFWPMLALVALILGLLGLFYLFATHWAFGLLGLGVLALALGAFAWWDRRRPPPPGLRP